MRYSLLLSNNPEAHILFKSILATYTYNVLDLSAILLCRVREFKRFSEKSDVYSFGVFLLELLSGKEATESPSPDSNQNLVEWVCDDVIIFIRHK